MSSVHRRNAAKHAALERALQLGNERKFQLVVFLLSIGKQKGAEAHETVARCSAATHLGCRNLVEGVRQQRTHTARPRTLGAAIS